MTYHHSSHTRRSACLSRLSARLRVAACAAVCVVAGVTVPVAAAPLTPPDAPAAQRPSAQVLAAPGTKQVGECSRTEVSDALSARVAILPRAHREVWGITRGRGQTVAIIDTGVSPHPRLPSLLGGGDFRPGGTGLTDCDAHGTAIAGIIAASESPHDDFSGVAPEVTLLSIRHNSRHFHAITRPTDNDRWYGTTTSLGSAIVSAVDQGATVVNISQVACSDNPIFFHSSAIAAALHYAVDVHDAVIVTAAGNVGGSCAQQNPASADPDAVSEEAPIATVASPAWYDDLVFTVGSVTADGAPSDFSLAGPWVDIAAVGEQYVSLGILPPPVPSPFASIRFADTGGLADTVQSPGQEPAGFTGTSFAAPYVAGVVALVRARHPELTAREVMERLERTALPLPGTSSEQVGAGLVDPVGAVTSVESATSRWEERHPALPGRKGLLPPNDFMSGDTEGNPGTPSPHGTTDNNTTRAAGQHAAVDHRSGTAGAVLALVGVIAAGVAIGALKRFFSKPSR